MSRDAMNASPHNPSLLGPLYPHYRKLRKIVVDAAAFLALLPLALWRLRETPSEGQPRAILVTALLKIGDTLTTFPSVGALQQRFPEARIALWVRPKMAPLARLHAGVDEVFAGTSLSTLRQIRKEKFDLALVCSFVPQHLLWARASGARRLVGYAYKERGFFCDIAVPAPPQVGLAVTDYPPGESILHQVEVVHLLARAAGATSPPESLSLAIPADETKRIAHLAGIDRQDAPAGLRVAFHPWNEQSHYRWPLERWTALAQKLIDAQRARIWIMGGPQERSASAHLTSLINRPKNVENTAGRFSLDETAALITRMDLVVSVDTMATHLASAVGRPVVALFGPGAPKVWRPLGEATVLQNTTVCHGCRQPRCYRPTHECMEGISVDEVYQAAIERLTPNPNPQSQNPKQSPIPKSKTKHGT